MRQIPVEKCLGASGGSVYKLTIMVAKRAQELAEGAKPLVESSDKDRPLIVAIAEIAQGCLKMDSASKQQA